MTGIAPFAPDRADLDRSPLDAKRLLSRPFWRELRTFLAVAKCRSYAQAAELLNTSAPTVSRDVKRLQEQIGAQLVVSNHSGVRLTPTGSMLALDLAELDYRLSVLSADLGREQGAYAGQVTVSAPPGLSVAFVAPSIARLNALYPEIDIQLKDHISFLNSDRNQADIQLVLTPSIRADVLCETVGTLHLLPVAARSYVARHGLPDQGDLAHHRFLQCSYYLDAGRRWDAWHGLIARGRVTHSCENSLSYYALAKAGAGIALLGNYTLLEGSMISVYSGVHVPLPIYVTAITDRMRSRPARAVYEWIRALFQENPFFGEDLMPEAGASGPENDFRAFFNLP